VIAEVGRCVRLNWTVRNFHGSYGRKASRRSNSQEKREGKCMRIYSKEKFGREKQTAQEVEEREDFYQSNMRISDNFVNSHLKRM
jgi:hypothetical protein